MQDVMITAFMSLSAALASGTGASELVVALLVACAFVALGLRDAAARLHHVGPSPRHSRARRPRAERV